MAFVPKYASRFVEALRAANIDSLQLDLCRPPVNGYRGILTTTRIQYNRDPINLLGRDFEYTFEFGNRRVELSLQLYLNLRDHYRLFCYTSTGMLFSVNLTLLHRRGNVIALSQTIRLATRGISAKDRAARTVQLCAAISRLGLEIDGTHLTLGTFDTRAGRFVDTTVRAFLRDFTLVSLLKGHYMGNKGYALPGMTRFTAAEQVMASRAMGARRLVPLSLRYQVLEAAGGRCVLCGHSPRDGIKLHVDHVTPFSHGGKTVAANLQCLCHKCNLGKGNRSHRRFGKS